jgi:hypothetical protein
VQSASSFEVPCDPRNPRFPDPWDPRHPRLLFVIREDSRNRPVLFVCDPRDPRHPRLLPIRDLRNPRRYEDLRNPRPGPGPCCILR